MTAITATATGYNGNLMTIITDNGLTITVDGDAALTNRVFSGWWGDASEGEEYISEWSDTGSDQDGNAYAITWRFAAVRGQEPEDNSDYAWDDASRIASIEER